MQSNIFLKCIPSTFQVLTFPSVKPICSELLNLLFYHRQHESNNNGGTFLSLAITPHEVSLIVENHIYLDLFKSLNAKSANVQWQAFQLVASELAVLQQVSAVLAKASISMLHISTYVTDYVLIPINDAARAVSVLKSALGVEVEESSSFSVEGADNQQENALPSDSSSSTKSSEDNHILSVPDMKLQLFGITPAFKTNHMHALIKLLLLSGNDDNHNRDTTFISYTETEDEISLMTSDDEFLSYVQHTGGGAHRGGIILSPDSFKIVQVGNTPLGFEETGIVAAHAAALSDTNTQLFYISTFCSDFLLIKVEEFDVAIECLSRKCTVLNNVFAPMIIL